MLDKSPIGDEERRPGGSSQQSGGWDVLKKNSSSQEEAASDTQHPNSDAHNYYYHTPDNIHELSGSVDKTLSSEKLQAAGRKGEQRIREILATAKSGYTDTTEHYRRRYKTDIIVTNPKDGSRPSVDIKVYVHGGDEYCYHIQLIDFEEKDGQYKDMIMEQTSFRKRCPDNATDQKKVVYPVGCGKFDEEVEVPGGWPPLHHDEILANMLQEVKSEASKNLQEYGKYAKFDPRVICSNGIVNNAAQAFIDSNIPDEEGQKTFTAFVPEYAQWAAEPTAEAKFRLAARLGMYISEIEIEKDSAIWRVYYELKPRNEEEMHKFDGRLMVNKQDESFYVIDGYDAFCEASRKRGPFRTANGDDVKRYVNTTSNTLSFWKSLRSLNLDQKSAELRRTLNAVVAYMANENVVPNSEITY